LERRVPVLRHRREGRRRRRGRRRPHQRPRLRPHRGDLRPGLEGLRGVRRARRRLHRQRQRLDRLHRWRAVRHGRGDRHLHAETPRPRPDGPAGADLHQVDPARHGAHPPVAGAFRTASSCRATGGGPITGPPPERELAPAQSGDLSGATADVAEFPAGKHAVLQITQTSPAGYDATVKRPEAIADLTAVLADEDCSAEPSESSSPASEPGGTAGPGASTSAKPSTSSSKPGEPKPSTSTKKVTTSTAKQTLKSTATTKVTSTTTTPKAAAPGASGGGSGKLPVTGAAVVPLAILAVSLIGLGAMLVISKRRRNAAEYHAAQ